MLHMYARINPLSIKIIYFLGFFPLCSPVIDTAYYFACSILQAQAMITCRSRTQPSLGFAPLKNQKAE